jgi:hypothetical protein
MDSTMRIKLGLEQLCAPQKLGAGPVNLLLVRYEKIENTKCYQNGRKTC